MTEKSLFKIRTAVDQWRKAKRYKTEPVPEDILRRARAAVVKHGLAKVVKETGIAYEVIRRKAAMRATRVRKKSHQIRRTSGREGRSGVDSSSVPSFSRVEISSPQAVRAVNPVMEVETATGLKVRVFSLTPETAEFISALSQGSIGAGGGQ
jgi:hypothetical protein